MPFRSQLGIVLHLCYNAQWQNCSPSTAQAGDWEGRHQVTLGSVGSHLHDNGHSSDCYYQPYIVRLDYWSKYHDWLAFKVWGSVIGSAVERQACTLQSCNLLSKILQEMRQVHPPQSAVKRPSWRNCLCSRRRDQVPKRQQFIFRCIDFNPTSQDQLICVSACRFWVAP